MAHIYYHMDQGRREEGPLPSLLGPLQGLESDPGKDPSLLC